MEWAYRRGSRRPLEGRAGPAVRSRLAVPRASWVHPPKASPTDWSPQETPPPPPRPLNPKKVRRSSSPTESPWPSALFVPHGHPRLKALTPCEARRAKDAPSALRPPRGVRRSRPGARSTLLAPPSASRQRSSAVFPAFNSPFPPRLFPPFPPSVPSALPVVIPPTPHRLAGGRPTGRPWMVTPLARGPGGAPRTVSGTTE